MTNYRPVPIIGQYKLCRLIRFYCDHANPLWSHLLPRNSNLFVVSEVQSIISAVDNLYSIDSGTVKDPDFSVVQETFHSEEPSNERTCIYAISLSSRPPVFVLNETISLGKPRAKD